MIDRIKSFLKEEENKRVATNFVSLTGLNFINYFFPIIVIPYLTRVLKKYTQNQGLQKNIIHFCKKFEKQKIIIIK
jgi:hypothetical protein